MTYLIMLPYIIPALFVTSLIQTAGYKTAALMVVSLHLINVEFSLREPMTYNQQPAVEYLYMHYSIPMDRVFGDASLCPTVDNWPLCVIEPV